MIVNTGHLGDVILALSAMRRVRDTFPHADIALITMEPAAMLARTGGWFTRVWVMPDLMGYGIYPRKYLQWFATFFRAVGWQPDLAISFMADPEDQVIIAATGAKLRVGPLKDHNWIYQRGWMTHPLRAALMPSPRHQRSHEVADACGFVDNRSGDAALSDLKLPQANIDAAKEFEVGGKRTVCLLVCGSNRRRRWPLDRYKQLAVELAKRGDVNLLVVSGPAERDIEAAIKLELADAGLAKHLCRQPLLTLLALLQRCQLAVTVDSGPGHLAAAAGCETIYLLPEHKRATFLPPGFHVHPVCARKVAEIPCDAVSQACAQVLSRSE